MTDFLKERMQQQLNFIHEIDKLKTVFRRTNLITEPDRLENSAEHSWHLAFYVLILAEYANAKIDLLRVLKMVLLHDIVEIDAGDTFCYDVQANLDKAEREQAAAKRIFGLLPDEQCAEFIGLWQEFEARETMDAKFAACIDHLQPLLHNYMTGGGSWKRHDIKLSQVENRMQPMPDGSVILSEIINAFVKKAVEEGMLAV